MTPCPHKSTACTLESKSIPRHPCHPRLVYLQKICQVCGATCIGEYRFDMATEDGIWMEVELVSNLPWRTADDQDQA